MPDNVQISDNPIIAADVIDGVSFQRVKPAWGADGTATDVSDAAPMPVAVKSIAPSSSVRISGSTELADVIDTGGTYKPIASALISPSGEVISFSTPYISEVDVTVQSTIYTANYNLSTNILQFQGAADEALTGWITQVEVIDKAAQKANMQIFFLKSSITPPTVNTAFSISDADMEKVVTVVDTTNGTWYESTNAAICLVEPGRARPYYVASGQILYAVVKMLGTPTYGVTTDVLKIRLHLLKD